MIDRDPQIAAVLDRLVAASAESGRWSRVLADAGAAAPPRPHLWRSRLAIAFAAVAALAAAFAFGPALAGQGYFWFLAFHGGAPKAISPVVTITSFTDQAGTRWQLTAYQSENKGLCIHLTNDVGSGAGECGAEPPIGWMTTNPSESSGTFVFGPVAADAEHVRVVTASQEIEATVTPGSNALGSHTKFYIAHVPDEAVGAPMTLYAIDAQGQLIASRPIDPRNR